MATDNHEMEILARAMCNRHAETGAGDDEQMRLENFARELAKLSVKWGVVVKSVGGVEFGDVLSVRYSNDATSGDLLPNVTWR